MKPEKNEETGGSRRHEECSARMQEPREENRKWFAALGWVILSVVVFAILFRLGFRAAQARRVTWMMAALGACFAAFRAVQAEACRPLRFSPLSLALLGALGGACVALLLSVLQSAPPDGTALLAGALIGGTLACIGRCWRQ